MEDNIITRKEKTKDPRRVEAGRRLAAISKEAKERKARERLELDRSEQNESSSTGLFVIGFLTIIVLGGAYFTLKKPPAPQPKQEEKRATNFISFDE